MATERFFEQTRLGVGAIENGDAFGVAAALVFFDLRSDKSSLAVTVICLAIEDTFTARIRRPELLFLLIYVVLDDRVGGIEDSLG